MSQTDEIIAIGDHRSESQYRGSLRISEQISSSSTVTPPVISIMVNNIKPTSPKDSDGGDSNRMFMAHCLFKQPNGSGAIGAAMDQMVAMAGSDQHRRMAIGSKSSDEPITSGQTSQIIVSPRMSSPRLSPAAVTIGKEANQKPILPNSGNSSAVEISQAFNHPEETGILEPRNKTIINLSDIMHQPQQESVDAAEMSQSLENKQPQLNKKEKPPMSTRRMQQLMQSEQAKAIQAKVHQICSSSVTQPIFQAIWKVILSQCFERQALKAFVHRSNLYTIPIRALHYQEILCLFRKAHGPILLIKRVNINQAISDSPKKPSIVTANETVQGFTDFNQFCKDLVEMLGDGVLLLSPDIYTIVAQLVFEAVSIQSQHDEENVIQLRRITDISSPFYTPITNHIPISLIFTMQTLDSIVKLFCMRVQSNEELKRLIERRFIPQNLMYKGDFRAARGDQLFDQIEKCIQHSAWKEKRAENNGQATSTRTQHIPPPEFGRVSPRHINTSAMKKISHMNKHQRVISMPGTGQASYNNCNEQQETHSDQSSDENQSIPPSYLGPKLNNMCGGIGIQGPVKNADLFISNYGADQQTLPVTVHDKKRRFLAKTKELHHGIDLQHMIQFNNHRTQFAKMRADAAKDSSVFNSRDDESDLSSNDEESNEEDQENQDECEGYSSPEEPFHIRQQMDDSGKLLNLSEVPSIPAEIIGTTKSNSVGKQTMAELLIEENRMLATENKGQMAQELFDFKPLFLTGGLLHAHDSQREPEFDAGFSLDSVENPCDLSFKEDEARIPNMKKVNLNRFKAFNRQNLQQCRKKNKLVIAANLRQHNHLLEMQGYNKSQILMGGGGSSSHRGKTSNNLHNKKIRESKKHDRRRQNSHVIYNGAIKRISKEEPCFLPAATARPSPRISRVMLDREPEHTLQLNSTFGGSLCSPSFEASSFVPGASSPRRNNNTTANVTDNNYIMSLQIVTCNSTTSNSKPVSSRHTASWARKASQLNGREYSPTSQKARHLSLGSPGKNKLSLKTAPLGWRQPQTQQNSKEGEDLSDAIRCRTIPMIDKTVTTPSIPEPASHANYNNGSPQAIPIRLHLFQASTSDHNNDPELLLRDSLMEPSQESNDQSKSISRDGEEDGHCTLRDDSAMAIEVNNRVALEHALKQVGIQNQFRNDNCVPQTQTILRVQPKNNPQAAQTPAFESQQQQTMSFQRPLSEVTESQQVSDDAEFYVSNAVDEQMSSQVSQSHVSGQVSGGGISGHVSGQVNLKAGTVGGISRARAISTADNQFRNKKTLKKDELNQCYRSEAQDQQQTSQGSAVDDKIVCEGRKIEDFSTRKEKKTINLGELGRWQACPEDTTGLVKPVQAIALNTEALSSNKSYTRQRPRDASSIDLVSLIPRKLIESNIFQLSKRSSGVSVPIQGQNGDFIAPRRAISRQQRLKIKTPISVLALHDFKGVKNVNLTICNQDLVASKFETETINLSQSIRTRASRQYNGARRISLGQQQQQQLRQQQLLQASQLLPLREPTPLRIVDLSAAPQPHNSVIRSQLTIKQEYQRTLPLLNNRTKPLRQEILRKAAGGRTSPFSTLASSGRRSPMTSMQNSMNKTGAGGLDLRSMVGYMIRSPAFSPTATPTPPIHSQRGYNH